MVLTLPRGGLPVGYEIAKALHAPLDVVIVRKLGVPWQPELAMGAIAGRGTQVLDRHLIAGLGISQQMVDAVIRKESAEIERREKLYRADRAEIDPLGRTVVLADDGLATGSTMLVAIRYVRMRKAAKIIVAVPVGSSEACARVEKEADELVCLAVPESFMAVGEWYRDFRQITDEEVRSWLEQSRRLSQTQGKELTRAR
jgi:putative phosphoribosyl transferase